LLLVYQTYPPCKRRAIGAIARIAEMIVGIIGGIAGIIGVIVGTEEMTVTGLTDITAGTSRKVFATDWIGDRKMFVIAGPLIRTTPAISEMVTLPIAKDSVGVMRKATANILEDGNY
jgi:hypothetical protein